MERMDDLINSKKIPQINQTRYNQVFENKMGFIPNLNILDVIFNLGPNASEYIKKANYKSSWGNWSTTEIGLWSESITLCVW